MDKPHDSPGVIAPPPLIALGALLLGLALDWLFPFHILRGIFGFWPRVILGGILIAAGVISAAAGRSGFVRVGTNIQPWKPALTLVTEGIYARMRNPMYVGLTLLLVGLAIALASDWTLILVIPAVLLLHFGVVKREERYLEAKFGESYRAYMRRVPRYGLPGMGYSREPS
jgi:protein-S-isoprenylcysteine O-methyltransferase Ste14